jgi:S1-C subfamily serine protease
MRVVSNNMVIQRPPAAYRSPTPYSGVGLTPMQSPQNVAAAPRFGMWRFFRDLAGLRRELAALRSERDQLKGQTDLSALMARVIPATAMIEVYQDPNAKPRVKLFENALPIRIPKRPPEPTLEEVPEADPDTVPLRIKIGPAAEGDPPEAPDPPLVELIEDEHSSSPPSPMELRVNPYVDEKAGTGSGFWIRCKDGKPRMLTNAHVADRTQTVYTAVSIFGESTPHMVPVGESSTPLKLIAKLNFNRTAEAVQSGNTQSQIAMKVATIPGTSKLAVSKDVDLALLEPIFYDVIGDEAFDLPNGVQPLELETDMKTLLPGHRVFKVGDSSGFSGNTAEGIVSGFRMWGNICPCCGKPHHEGDPSKEFLAIETTAPLNAGDSGGPLVDMRGKAVGVNFIRIANGGEGQDPPVIGMAYAIAAPVVHQQLKAWGFMK